jgi:hypothetical protein
MWRHPWLAVFDVRCDFAVECLVLADGLTFAVLSPIVSFCLPSAEIKRATAKIHSMSLRLYDSKHDFLYSIFKPFIKNHARQVRARAHARERERERERENACSV